MVTVAPERTTTHPAVAPATQPERERRYAPNPDHCPQQRVRTVRRVRRVIEQRRRTPTPLDRLYGRAA